jgi:hypothetical protein
MDIMKSLCRRILTLLHPGPIRRSIAKQRPDEAPGTTGETFTVVQMEPPPAVPYGVILYAGDRQFYGTCDPVSAGVRLQVPDVVVVRQATTSSAPVERLMDHVPDGSQYRFVRAHDAWRRAAP